MPWFNFTISVDERAVRRSGPKPDQVQTLRRGPRDAVEIARGVPRQRIDERAESNPPGPLRGGGQEHARRRRHPERRGVVLGQVIAEESCRVSGFEQLQALLVDLGQWCGAAVDPVEEPECDWRHWGI